MTTFAQFLFEDDLSKITPKEAAEKVARDCSFFLEESGFTATETGVQNALFRGMGDAAATTFFSKINARTDRQPLSTSPGIHEVLDNFFKHHFGFPFRSAGTFAMGYANNAAYYGPLYMIFPIGRFKYVWSPSIADAYESFDGSGGSGPDSQDLIIEYAESQGMEFDEDDMRRIPFSKKWADALELYLDAYPKKYKSTDLKSALSIYEYRKHEVMLSCPSYYAVPINSTQHHVSAKLQDQVTDFLSELSGM